MTRTVEDCRDTYCDKELIVALRETLAKYQTPIVIAAGVAIVVCVAFSIYEIMGSSHSHLTVPAQTYYSDDDGLTYFMDDLTQVPPYNHNGKMAVQAIVFQCPGGAPFVAILEKFTDAEKKKIDAEMAKPTPNIVTITELRGAGQLGKVVKNGTWQPLNDIPAKAFLPLCDDQTPATRLLIPN
jgi:hypothetical protein